MGPRTAYSVSRTERQMSSRWSTESPRESEGSDCSRRCRGALAGGAGDAVSPEMNSGASPHPPPHSRGSPESSSNSSTSSHSADMAVHDPEQLLVHLVGLLAAGADRGRRTVLEVISHELAADGSERLV